MRMYVMNVGKNYKEAEEVEYMGKKYRNIMIPLEILKNEFSYDKIIAIIPTEEAENELENLKGRIDSSKIKKIKIQNIEDQNAFFQNVLVNLSKEIKEEERSTIHFDTTTGFKYTTTLVLLALQIIEKEKEASIEYFYQFFNEKTKKGKLINLEKYSLIFKIVADMEEAVNTLDPQKIEEISKDAKELFRKSNTKFMGKINEIREFLKNIYETGTIGELDESLEGLDGIQKYIVSALIKKLKKEFKPFMEKEGEAKSNEEAMLLTSEYHNKRKHLRDAVIFLEEAYITKICKELGMDGNKKDDREMVTKLLGKLETKERGIFGNIQNWRNYLAHAGTGRKTQNSQNISPKKIEKYIKKCEEECRRIAELIKNKQREKNIYLASSFSLNMFDINKYPSGNAYFKVISDEEAINILAKNKFISVIGHEATAQHISEIIGKKVEVNRSEIRLKPFDEVLVFQLLKRFEKFGEKSKEDIEKTPYRWVRVII
ncbi:MAG: TM1812 family CRISPR-associated protein [Candidatus Anstonellales archaeon]